MIAAVFPGQGSQKPGMGKELYDSFPAARQVFSEVSKASHIDVARLCFESDEEGLRQTQNAQLALYTCSVAAWSVLRGEKQSLKVHAMAGHSVGEYAALACAGVVSVEAGAKLVQRRGDLMARSGTLRAGAMAAVLGMERDGLERVCEQASTVDEVAVIANDNCPGQLVISGDAAAVARAGELASAQGAKRVLPLNVSGAFHSPLMHEPAVAMGEALKSSSFHEPAEEVRVYSNVTAERVDGITAWPSLLEAQLRSPVRWTESVQNMIRDGVTTFVECGSGEVLSGLIRRIDKGVTTLSVGDAATLEKALSALND
ncbi:MAG TPA: ACP S-malonyltransferase [Fimbriimonadaceae bacterium]|nr:ACP S-malonyltransferase [Fimbriimonadaceae bacterium]